MWGYITLSRLERARGDEECALEMARKAQKAARDSGADLEITIAAAWMARLRVARGDLTEASRWERERAANADDAADAARMVHRITSARLLHARGRHQEALRMLDELGEAAESAGRTSDLIVILALQALALWASNEKERAVSTLTRALALAEPEGYVRTFVDEGAAMGDLLSSTLETRQRSRLDAAAPAAGERLTEPLSERELEVLAFIATGKSNGETAGKLFVSMSTARPTSTTSTASWRCAAAPGR